MTIILAKNYAEMSRAAAAYIADIVRAKSNAVLGLATGSTPVGTYEELARMHREENLSFADAAAFNLDEYIGLDANHHQSYAYFMRTNLFDHIDLPASRRDIPNGSVADVRAECRRYEAAIKAAGGIDIQLLGLGPNGHIGFNEPCDVFPAATHSVELERETIDANSRFFAPGEHQPTSALTMGIGTIMAAKSVLLIVGDAHKADILRRAMQGDIDPRVPASALQFHHNLTVITTTTL